MHGGHGARTGRGFVGIKYMPPSKPFKHALQFSATRVPGLEIARLARAAGYHEPLDNVSYDVRC